MQKPPPTLIRSARDAESVAATWLRYFGFSDARATPVGADGGIDVVSAFIVAQVKTEAKPTGRPVVQQLAGVASHSQVPGAVFSLAGFTAQASDWADDAGVALFRFDLQGEPVPENRHAVAIAAGIPIPEDWNAQLNERCQRVRQLLDEENRAFEPLRFGQVTPGAGTPEEEKWLTTWQRLEQESKRLWVFAAALDRADRSFMFDPFISTLLAFHAPSQNEDMSQRRQELAGFPSTRVELTLDDEDIAFIRRHTNIAR